MTRSLRALVIGGIAATLALGGPAAGLAVEKIKLLISTRGPLDLFIPNQAEGEGYFKAEDLDVEITYAQGGAETAQALATGAADIAVGVGIQSVIAAFGKGAPLRIIANGKLGGGEIFWFVKKDSPIKTLKDLEGKVLVYSRPGSTTHLIAQTLVRMSGVKARLVSVGGMASSRTQVMSGQVDTGWGSFPNNMDVVQKGEARVVVTGAEATELNDFAMRVTAANAAFLKNRRDAAVRFMRAYHKAMVWQINNPGPAIKRWAEAEKLELELAMQAPKYFPPETMRLAPIGNLDGNIKLAVEAKMLAQPLSEAQKKELVDIVFDPGK